MPTIDHKVPALASLLPVKSSTIGTMAMPQRLVTRLVAAKYHSR